MKVCILSMQKINNMGSLLQAYGLKKILENIGCEVEYIDIKRIDEDYDLLGNYKQDFSKEIEKTGFIGKISKSDRYLLNRLNHKPLEKKQDNCFEKFRSNQLNLSNSSSEYDVCVIGSDEVFNCLNAGYWGFTSQLFGNVPEAKKVITYAASCGATTYADLPKQVENRIRELFKNVSAFSVRDVNTKDFVIHLSDQGVSEHLDPVLAYNFDSEVEQTDLIEIKEQYCIVYSYRNRIHSKDEIKAIKTFCKKHSLRPIAVGAPQFWIKDYVVCSPFQCLKLFENASFVITDTFHGTIFSIRYANKFAVLTRDSNRNKLGDLVTRLAIDSHLMNGINDLEKVYRFTKDADKIRSIISREQSRSINYLKENIN